MQVIVDIPDEFSIDHSLGDLAGHLKLSTALLMFQAGQLSAGAACEFAGVDRYTFLAACRQYGVAAVDYDDDEVATDFEDLKKGR